MVKPLELRLTFVIQGAFLIALAQSSIITKPAIHPPSPALSPCSDVDISDYDLENLKSNICNNNKILICLSKIIEAIKRRDQSSSNVIVPPCGCGHSVPHGDYNHGHPGHHADHPLVDHLLNIEGHNLVGHVDHHLVDHHLKNHVDHHLKHHVDHVDHHLVNHGGHHLVDHVDHHLVNHGDHHLVHHGETVHHKDHHHHEEHKGEYQQQIHHEGHNLQEHLHGHQLEKHGDHHLVHQGQHHQVQYDKQHEHLHQVHQAHQEAHNFDHGVHHKIHYEDDIHVHHGGKIKIEETVEKTTSHVTEQSKAEAAKIDISSKAISENHGNQKIFVSHDSELSGNINSETATKHEKSFSSNHEIASIEKKEVDESSSSSTVHSKSIADTTKVNSGYLKGVSTEHKDISRENTKFNHVDVSKSTEHKDISIENTKVKHVDVSKSTEHKDVSIENTKVKHVDVSKSTEHKDVSKENTKFKHVDVSKSTEHKDVSIENTKVKHVDVSKSTEHKDVSIENTKVKHVDVSKSTVSHSDKSSSEFEAVKAHIGKSIVAHDTTIGIEGHQGHYHHEDHHGHQQHVNLHGYHGHVDHQVDHHVHDNGHHLDHHGHDHIHHLDVHALHQEVHEGGHQEYYSNDHHGVSDVLVSTGIEKDTEIVKGVPSINGAVHETYVAGDYPVPGIDDSQKPDYVGILTQHTPPIDYVDQGTGSIFNPANPIVPHINQPQNQPILYPYIPPYIPGPPTGSTYSQNGIVTPDAAQQYLKPNFWEYPYPWFLYSSFPPAVHPSANIHHEFVVNRNCSHEHKFPVYHGIPDQHIWTGDCFENTRSVILSPPGNQDINCQKITRHVSHNLGGAGTTNSKSITNIVSKHIKH